MSYADYTKTRGNIDILNEDVIFSLLAEKTVDRIHDLALFYSVGIKIRGSQQMKCPSCIVLPKKIEIIESPVSGKRFQNDYYVSFGVAVKGPNDCILMQQVLGYEKKIRSAFIVGDDGAPILIFSSVAGHYNTRIIPSIIEPIDLFAEEILGFSCGFDVVYSVWESY